jgi:hypothetical protein
MKIKENPVREKVLKGMDLTCKNLLKHKKERNLQLIISDNGKIIRIRPEDLS